MSAFKYFSFSSLIFLPIAWLWFRLIDHLRVEWAVNPQYSYGWAVPFLCAYLVWLRLKDKGKGGLRDHETTGLRDHGLILPQHASRTDCDGATERRVTHYVSPFSFSAFQVFSIFLLCFLYLPTRLIQEANPEWRLVSWALAFEVIGITLLLLRTTDHGPRSTGLLTTDHRPRTTDHASRFTFHVSRFTFPILFFLVAVPWPTFLEAPLVQGLMRANVGVTIELLNLLGIPAAQHGNVIEVATGMVGIDDACSGIRSFQATLMLSLFLGELYALTARRRALCVFAGFALSFLFNIGRTTLLTWVAAHKGTAAIASWHDPAGITILVACFLCLWISARGLRGKAETLKTETLKSAMPEAEMLKAENGGEKAESEGPGLVTSSPVVCGPPRFRFSAFQGFSIFLVAWLVVVEAGTELWYRSHEWGVPMASTWRVEYPRDKATFQELPLSDRTKQFLRYDEGYNGTWQEGADQRWQVIFLRWDPGRIAVHLAKSHTPEVCLTAAGRKLVSQSGLHLIRVQGLGLPFRSYVVKDESGPLNVFYCLWEDCANGQSFRTTRMTYTSRLAPVMAGRRNSGQRSLEVAIWGIADQEAAEVALTRELEKLIKVGK